MSSQLSLLRRQINQGKADAIKRMGSGFLATERMQADFLSRCQSIWLMCQTDGWKNVLLPMIENLANPYNAYMEDGYDQKALLTSNIATKLLLTIENMYGVAEKATQSKDGHSDQAA